MLTHLPVGRDRTLEPVAAVRDPRQRQTVAWIADRPGFQFVCGNPFVPEVNDYVGWFAFLWYEEDELHSAHIDGDGSIRRELVVRDGKAVPVS